MTDALAFSPAKALRRLRAWASPPQRQAIECKALVQQRRAGRVDKNLQLP